MPWLQAPAIPAPFVHGFATREVDPGATLREAGLRLYRARQVHGAEVVVVAPTDDPWEIRERHADVVITAAAGLAVGVVTADCVPILLCAPAVGACAAVHAGWRGTVARSVRAAVVALRDRCGARPADLVAAIGPAICASCYDIGDEVATAVAVIDPLAVSRKADGCFHADLRRANRTLLTRAGLDPAAIHDVAGCTRCDARGRFHSYRRDRDLRGELLAFLGRPE
jgi:hypothetical protein